MSGGPLSIAAAAPIRLQLQVRGVVQGVGFRPWIYNLARRHALAGFVLNSPRGVFIEIEGLPAAIESFLAAVHSEAPPLVRIAEILRSEVPPTGDSAFVIRESDAAGSAFALVPPDICVCEACLADTRDPANRRFDYPFTNCTNCGPRYSIILDIPYDRPLTTMAEFAMCPDCLCEYRDPANRRFHAQPNACPICGPRLSFALSHIEVDRMSAALKGHGLSRAGNPEEEPGLQPLRDVVTSPKSPPGAPPLSPAGACPGRGRVNDRVEWGDRVGSARQSGSAILTRIADVLASGGIVAWKGLGGYQLACDATNPAAVEELRRRKHRSEKPFAVMVADAELAATLCFLSPDERAVLISRERPIVLLRRRPESTLAGAVSPGNPTTGVMLPCTPMHDILFRILREQWGREPALIMTSGNLSEEPIVIDTAEAESRLAGVADAFVHHNRPIHTRVDDSVVRVVAGQTMLLRRARGYAPQPVFLGRGEAEVLACGAQQKNTLCLTRAGFALPSQHLGDLENYETLRFFEETLERMSRLFHVRPTAIAHDLHPGYLSTQFALRYSGETGLRAIPVQHHHAHVASCMAEHHLQGEVIGVAWDGTGLGTDSTIWGGEFLIASYTSFTRRARLRPVLLPGGDSAVREPFRVARSYLLDLENESGAPPLGAPSLSPAGACPELGRESGRVERDDRVGSNLSSQFLHTWESAISPNRLRIVDGMLRRRVNTIPTSSAGRLFDAVASLIHLRHIVSFEGQAAIMLEAAADEWPEAAPPYDFDIGLTAGGPAAGGQSWALSAASCLELDLRPMIRQILDDVLHSVPQPRIAACFHATLISALAAVCCRLRETTGLDRVCLSGGCFQNARLLSGSLAALQSAGFQVFTHCEVPANDGGISLGQAAIACEWLRAGN